MEYCPRVSKSVKMVSPFVHLGWVWGPKSQWKALGSRLSTSTELADD